MRNSYSSLQTLQACERKFAYRYIMGLERAGEEPVKFVRGHAFHALVQAGLLATGAAKDSLLVRPAKIEVFQGSLELGINWTDPLLPTITDSEFGPEIPLTPFSLLEHMRYWEAAQEGERQDEMKEAFGGASLYELMNGLWRRYAAHWRAQSERQLPLLTEQWWRRTAPNGEVLQGRVDAVVYDPEMDLVIVRDTKTHDSWPSESDTVLDLMESQNHMNLWGLAPELRELSDGKYTPSAVEFDRVRSKRPTTPKLTLKGALSASIKDYDRYTYEEWCGTQPTYEVVVKDPATGEKFTETRVYEFDAEVAAKAEENGEAWFRRSLKPLSMNAVTAHVMAAQKQATRANALTIEDAGLSPSKACSWCDYAKICRAEIIGGKIEDLVPQDYDLRARTKRY